MPKIFGKVAVLPNGNLRCEDCGYTWVHNREELKEIQLGHKISCPMCRALKGLQSGQFVDKAKRFRLIRIKDTSTDNLKSYDAVAQLSCSRCNNTFEAKLTSIFNGNISCPRCSSAKRITPEAVVKPVKADSKSLTEIVVQNKASKDAEVVKVKQDNLSKGMGKKISGLARLVDMDTEANTLTVQCPKCGFEHTCAVHSNIFKKSKSTVLECPICSKDKLNLDKLKENYLGRVFNGLKIDKIYIDGEDTLCDVYCLNAAQVSLAAYKQRLNDKGNTTISFMAKDTLHVQEGLPLGDVINCRAYCKICGDKKISENYRLKRYVTCAVGGNPHQFNEAAKRRGNAVPKVFTDMNCKDYYESLKGSLCDFCNGKLNGCAKANSSVYNSIKMINNSVDIQDSLVSDMLDIEGAFPNLFSIKTDDPDLEIHSDKDLIVVKDAFYNRNGEICKFCYCRKHAKGLILTEQEIHSFEHNECMGTDPYMKLYNMSQTALLNKPSKAGK